MRSMSSPTARSTASPAGSPAAGAGPVRPSAGWGVVHLMLRAAPGAPGAEDALEAIDAFAAVDPQQVVAFSVLGGRADVGLMAIGPDLDALDALVKRVLRRAVRAGLLLRLAHRAERVHEHRGRRAGAARGRGRGGRRGAPGRVARPDGGLPGGPPAPAPARPRHDRLLPDVQAPRRGRQLVRAELRGAQAPDGRPRAGGPPVRRPHPAADHRRDRPRRLGVGRDAARRRPRGDQGDRLRDALRRGQLALRRVRALLRRAW